MKSKMLICLLAMSGFAFADCTALMEKYRAPDPAAKTMNQIKRWIKKINDPADAKQLEDCMIAKAADNPNKIQVAGR